MSPPIKHMQPPPPLVDVSSIYLWIDFVAVPFNAGLDFDVAMVKVCRNLPVDGMKKVSFQ